MAAVDLTLQRRLRLALAIAWLLFWGLMMGTAVQDYRRNDAGPLWHPLLWEGSSLCTVTLLLLLQRRATRRHDHLVTQPRRWFLRQAPWLLLYWIAFVPIAFGIRHGVYALAGDVYRHTPWPTTFFYEDVKITVFFAMFVLITFGILSWQAMQEERLRAERMAAQLRTAQLQQLTQQMQPHFLFNALNTISATMYEDVPRADALLLRLADVLRATLAAGQQQQVPLAAELRLLRGYAALMGERFSDRVTIAWQVDDSLAPCLVPVMGMQPLLENVFRHTVERTLAPVHIVVGVQRSGQALLLTVEDDAGSLAAPAGPGAGIALANLRARLAALHGEDASLTLSQRAPAGVCATLLLPYREAPCAC
ncbi:histidine kinase [Pseudoduganella lurida]|uniref:Histidine kinase n=1 Tax=Pseudoduganella lurida TaxID=1036180 RepID=A0A562RFM4_9BURK|nr:histidine kinase [Pseudoduganella lurida]TWI67693.1 histidine kinase [Pseudoduganella lurida]